MASIQRVGDLEIGQDVDFQRREWAVQRVAWVVAALILAAALLGLLGAGPLSRVTGEASPLRVEYFRFERKHAPTRLRIEAAPGSAQEGQLRLWMDRNYVAGVEIQQIEPEPEQVMVAGNRMEFTFQVADPGQPSEVVIPMQHDAWGIKTARVGLVDGPELAFKQLVYP